MSQCSGIKASGGRCKAQAITGSQWCFSHHPDRAEQRRRAAQRGGKRGGRGRPQAELADLKARLRELAEQVLAGDVPPNVGAVVSQILNTVIRAVGVELKVREQLELEARLAELEDRLGQEERRRGA